MYNPDNCKDDLKKEHKDKDNECCVIVNIFCADKKESKYKEEDYKDDYKKEYERKDEKCCVIVNIFCEKCKKDYIW